MVEEQVGFLFKIASSFPNSPDSRSHSLLQSYYLLQCKEITRGFGLPEKHFSPKVRCSHCCLEWRNGTTRKKKKIKLSKNQKRRIKALKCDNANVKKRDYITRRKALLTSNELEQICSFCRQKTVMLTPKGYKKNPRIESGEKSVKKKELIPTSSVTVSKTMKDKKTNHKANSEDKNSRIVTNVYSDSKNVFSLHNNKNTLQSTVEEPKKVINNNKKRKDKFAGLCQMAVLASAKIKEDKRKQNKINLFLKPTTT